jgi:hypothetical protein
MAEVSIKGDLSQALAPTPAPALASVVEHDLTTPEGRKAAALEAARKVPPPRYTLQPGKDWRDILGGRVGLCHSAPNAAGQVFDYVVWQHKGKDTAVPVAAIYLIQEDL